MRFLPVIMGLVILSVVSGCKRETINSTSAPTFDFGPDLMPINSVQPGEVLRWRTSKDRGSIVLDFEKGLCEEGERSVATSEKAAQCTVAKQTFKEGQQFIIYRYRIAERGKNIDPDAYLAIDRCRACAAVDTTPQLPQ